MPLDVSTLSLRVDSGGTITQAASDLNKFSNEAEKAETRATSLLATIGKLSDVFATNSASAQAFSETVSGIAENTSTRVTSTEQAQWDKLTQQYDSYRNTRLAKQRDLENKQYDAAMADYSKELNAEMAKYDKEIKAQQAAYDKEMKAQESFLEKQRLLNARYAAISESAQLNTLKRAQAYGNAGGDVTKQFGSTVASQADVDNIAKLEQKMKDAASAGHSLSLANAGVTRELVVMGGEIQRGNWSRFDGSMVVMANRMNLLQYAIKAFSVEGLIAFGALAAAAVYLVKQFADAEAELSKFNNAMLVTGGFAGVTLDGIEKMANAMRDDLGGTVKQMRTTLEELASTGKFTGGELQTVGEVVVKLSRLTGKSTEDIAKQFDNVKGHVAEWAEKQNETYHFLDSATLRYVQSLEKQGKESLAFDIVMSKLNESLDISKEKVNALLIPFKGWGMILDDLSDKIKKVMGFATDSEKINTELQKLDELKKSLAVNKASGSFNNTAAMEAEIKEQTKKVHDLISAANAAEIAAAKKQHDDLLHMEALSASDHLKLITQHDATEKEIRDKNATDIRVWAKIVNEEALESGKKRVYTDQQINDMVEQDALKHHDRMRGLDDPRHEELEISLEKLKGDFELEKKAYEDNVKDVAELEKTKQISSAEFLSKATTEREIYRVEVNAFYDASIKALQNYASRNKVETAAISLEIQKLADARKTANAEIDASEKGDKRTVDEAELQYRKDLIKQIESDANKELDGYKKTLNAMEKHLEMLGKTKVEQERLTEAQAKSAVLETKIQIAALTADVNSGKLSAGQLQVENQLIQNLQSKLAVLEKIQAVAADTAPLQAQVDLEKLQTQEIEKGVQAAKEFEKQMVTAFGSIGKAVGGITVAFASYSKKMLEVDKERKVGLAAAKNDEEAAIVNQKAYSDGMEAQLSMWGDISSSAQGFFKEGSKGYQVLGAISQAFHVAQMAMHLAEMGLLAVRAVMRAAGDGGWVGMIAMAAAMAALGYAVSGGFNSSSGTAVSAADRQASQGTGTVLGDVTAKSNSIANSMELLSKNSNIGLQYSSQMLAALNSINSAMTGVASAIARTVGITTGNGFDIQEGTLSKNTGDGLTKQIFGFNDSGLTSSTLPKWASNIVAGVQSLFGKVDQSITDSGIGLYGSLGNLAHGGGMSQYADVSTTSSSWFGLVKDTKNSTQEKAIDSELQQQFSLIFSGLDTAMKATASALGVNSAALSSQIDNFNLNIGKVSFKGLTGQALTDALNNVVSAAADSLAQSVLPGLEQFQKAGEGYFQTAVRVANATEAAGADLYQLGLKAINYTSIINKQGDVETEIVRQTVSWNAYTKSLVGVKAIIDSFSGSAADLAKAYTQLLEISSEMTNAKLNGLSLSANTVQGAGDLSALSSGIKDFQSNFFSQADQVQMETEAMAEQFVKLGVAMPASRDGFQQLVRGIDSGTASGQKLMGALLALSGSFSKVLDDAQALRQTNIDGLNTQASALQTTEDALKSFQTSLKQFSNSLVLGANSVLTPLQKLNAAQGQYETTLAAAKSGDTTAQGNLQNSATAYLDASRTANASSDAYTSTYDKVQADLAGVINKTGGQISDAQAQINALNSQVSLLTTINTATSNTSTNTSTLAIYAQQSFAAITAQANAQAANIAAINALTKQVAQLRQEQSQQTGQLIGATVTSSHQNAQTIVNGTSAAAQKQAWQAMNGNGSVI